MNKEDDRGKRTAYTCPYHADDFRVRLFLHPEQHTTLIQLQMPKPQSMLLCRHIYLALNTETGEKFFYTIERSQNGTFLLCGWQENGGHVIFNRDVEASPELDQKEILELFSRSAEIQREMDLVKASMKKNR